MYTGQQDLSPLSQKEQEDIQRIGLYYRKVQAAIQQADERLALSKQVKILQTQAIRLTALAELETYSPACREALIDELRHILMSDGFFIISEHGIPKKLIHDLIQQSRQFFSQNRQEKQKHILPSSTMRGWANPSYTRYSEDKNEVLEIYKEAYHFGPDYEPYDKNSWPEDLNYKVSIQAYYEYMEQIEKILLQSLACVLGKERNYLVDLAVPHKGLLRFNYFDTREVALATPSISFGAHTDWGTITILVQEKPGLEVVHKGEWHAIFPPEDQLVVNLGDLMSLWSNGNYVSTVHRARHENGQTRISIPYFGGHSLHPTDRTLIRPIVQAGEAIRVEPTTFYDHIHLHYKHFDKIIRV